jgi:hypothetical protein
LFCQQLLLVGLAREELVGTSDGLQEGIKLVIVVGSLFKAINLTHMAQSLIFRKPFFWLLFFCFFTGLQRSTKPFKASTNTFGE